MPISASHSTGKGGQTWDLGTDVAGIESRSPVLAELLTISDVALMLSCSTRHLRRLIDARKCPAPVRLSTLVRLRRSDIERWIENGCPDCRQLRKTGQ